MTTFQNHKNLLKQVYFDIINGYSSVKYDSYTVFIKHPGAFDSLKSDILYNSVYEDVIAKKLITNSERLEYLKQNGLWGENEENQIKDKKLFIENLKNNRSKLALIKSQYDQMTTEISNAQLELSILEDKKVSLAGITAETFAAKKSNAYFVVGSFYKDNLFKEKLFSEEDCELLDDGEITDLVIIFNKNAENFLPNNIKKISIAPYFMNFFVLCDNDPVKFYGKPILNLTFYQAELFSHACYFKNVISEVRDKITPEMMENPDELISTYESSKNITKAIESNKGTAARGVMGATKEDYIKMGMGDQLAPDLRELAKQKGGKLSVLDIARAHGEI